MVDLNKEIKLSELFKRPKKPKGPRGPRPAAKPKAPKRQELVGLKVGASQIAASRIVNDRGARLMQLARSPLARGIVVAGEVRDVEALGRALDRFFTDHKLPRRGVRLGIGTNRVGVRALNIDGIDDERQLGNAVRFRAHEALSIPMDQAVLDYHVVGETADEAGAITRHVVLAAAYKEPIDHYVEACQLARIQLVGIDLEAFALLRAVGPGISANGAGPAAVVALSLGHDRSTLAISDGTICEFTRVLEWGGAKLENAVGRELGLTDEEAGELKLGVSLLAESEPATDADARLARARAAILREIQNLARELVASLQFYQTQPGSLPIAEILVTGGTSQLPGLVAELERLTRARVRVADPLAAVRAERGVDERDDLASLAVAIGLGVDV